MVAVGELARQLAEIHVGLGTDHGLRRPTAPGRAGEAGRRGGKKAHPGDACVGCRLAAISIMLMTVMTFNKCFLPIKGGGVPVCRETNFP